MANPPVLPCDTDALIQLFLVATQTKSLIPLRMLKDDFGIQPTIVAEVETELMWSRRYNDRFVPLLRKALGNGTIAVLDVALFAMHVPSHLANGVFDTYQSIAQQYSKVVDRGEAHTLAAALTLSVPAMSNDWTALQALNHNGFSVPSPVLRSFDLLAFACHTGALSEKECDDARKELVRHSEGVPKAFKSVSFREGIKNFCPRLLEDGKPALGTPPKLGRGYSAQICVKRK